MTQRQPGVLGTLFRAQFFHKEAEACGRLPGAVAVVLLVVTTLMTAFPFIYGRFTRSWDNGIAAHYPGLGTAWLETARQGGDFRIEKGHFVAGPTTPAEFQAGDWTIVLDPASQVVTPPGKPYLRVVNDRLAIGEGPWKTDGPLAALEGISGDDLRRLSAQREEFTNFVKGSLFALATAETPGAFVTVTGLMFLQNLLFLLVLGAFLSMSAIRVAGALPNARRRAGFWPSLKTVAALSLGPSFLAALVGFINPSWGLAVGMLAYSLLLGLRVVVVYMARFNDKKRTQES